MTGHRGDSAQKPGPYSTSELPAGVSKLLTAYCHTCHSPDKKKGGLDLQRFASLDHVRKDLKVWQQLIEQVETGEMPPKDRPQPTAAERTELLAWVRGFLDAEAQRSAGDPGYVPLRRLSNTEYDCTIRDLTGVDLRPTREFPADGAAGEGFTNAAESLSDISPTLLNKYLNAAKEIADHAVMLPDGFRFSPGKSRRDWTDESTAKLRAFYRQYASDDGRLPVQPYLVAVVRHRDALLAFDISLDTVASREKLNRKYLGVLWLALTGKTPSQPLDTIREKWKTSTEIDVPAVVKEITIHQSKLWKTERIGSYMRKVDKSYEVNETRQIPTDVSPGASEFRQVFPLYVCFPQVVPTDEVVSLKMFHREDEPLIRLFLDEPFTRQLERLWTEHRFISRQPVAENEYLPLFIGFVTQDQPKEMVAHFEGQRTSFKARAEEFHKEEEAAIPAQMIALKNFASRAYRRPLSAKEQAGFEVLHRQMRDNGATQDQAMRRLIARVLVAPAFLFRIERAPLGVEPGSIDDWQLATRMSYFLWSSMPDDELRKLADARRLSEAHVFDGQVRRMLADPRLRSLAIEFGTQWIHVRGFDENNEKNEKLFRTFDAKLRSAMYEESILFFQDLFQNDRRVTQILDADYAFLNETLAKHYGIPGVAGPAWRRVEGVKRHGRGGVLGMASVLAKQAGASRSSPVLRGNWVVETLLGEKLPRPRADVPKLPESEGDGGLTMRQQVERHAKDASCAACHVRIDPFGFALENYDAIGRLRQKDLGGLAIDARAKLRDGTDFEGIDGLRDYLLTKKKDVVIRLFCRRLLGYALGRSVTLSDQTLLDEMVTALEENDGRVSAAVLTIVNSPQFRRIRGSDYAE